MSRPSHSFSFDPSGGKIIGLKNNPQQHRPKCGCYELLKICSSGKCECWRDVVKEEKHLGDRFSSGAPVTQPERERESPSFSLLLRANISPNFFANTNFSSRFLSLAPENASPRQTTKKQERAGRKYARVKFRAAPGLFLILKGF